MVGELESEINGETLHKTEENRDRTKSIKSPIATLVCWIWEGEKER